MSARVRGIRSVAIDVCALEDAAAFYENVWRLAPVARAERARYFRGTCAHHHILRLQAAGEKLTDLWLWNGWQRSDARRRRHWGSI